ncbi:TetR/AcrR family transcriptional regulator [Pseudonocardia aurantiaca]|uniref:TetR/AcrR family transcriptional regulator n=1 Tax=Pseudonocardia aurantiaca TaxID=75290 RepID=A0ABW4FR25_9PSEU
MTDQRMRRTVILTSAARLFAEKGFAATTVREIADSVGVLSGSLYHHFPSKEAIVGEVVDSYLSDLLTGYRAVIARDLPPREAVRELVVASAEAIIRHPHATDIYRRERRRVHEGADAQRLGDAADEVKQTWLTVLAQGRAGGAFRGDVPTWIAYRLIRDALFHSSPVSTPDTTDPATALAETFATVVLDGLTRPPRRTAGRTDRRSS